MPKSLDGPSEIIDSALIEVQVAIYGAKNFSTK
jgi:hypothetical protein